MFEREGFKFDLLTQRFLVNRWETELGRKVSEQVIRGLKRNVEIRCILDDYVIESPEGSDPYGFPVYPKSEMQPDTFWVLNVDDLRGIQIFSEDFSDSPSFEKKSLS